MGGDQRWGPETVSSPDALMWRFSGTTEDLRILSFEISGPHCGSETVPFKERCVVGRDPQLCDFVIDDPSISRRHAEIKYFIGRGIGLRDLGSTNKTQLDDVVLTDEFRFVEVGSRVKFGRVELTISHPR